VTLVCGHNYLNRFIIIAEECRALRNYNGVMGIIASLQSIPIYRLKKTWQLLPSKTIEIWESLTQLMSSNDNYAKYRAALKEADSPAIPYLGISLTDLTFVEEGNKDYWDENNSLVNLNKLRYIASIIHFMEKLKEKPYDIAPVVPVQQLVMFCHHRSEEELIELSLKLEKRSNKSNFSCK